MNCRVHGPEFNRFRPSFNGVFWEGDPRAFNTLDAAVIFVMESAPSDDLEKVEIRTDSGDLHAILAIARRYREIGDQRSKQYHRRGVE